MTPRTPRRSQRVLVLVALLIVASALSWWVLSTRRSTPATGSLTVYYTKLDGTTEVPWPVSMRPRAAGESDASYVRETVKYAAVQAVAGPASDVQAIRFPPGTHVLAVDVTATTATVDLSREVEQQTGGSFGENGEFKALVYSLTSIGGIDAVQVKVVGRTLETLPGGHLALDGPLRRSDW